MSGALALKQHGVDSATDAIPQMGSVEESLKRTPSSTHAGAVVACDH
jgi:hypothetical protein